jgi:hypothetical protein
MSVIDTTHCFKKAILYKRSNDINHISKELPHGLNEEVTGTSYREGP